jgi:hypothetical protein
MPSPSADRNDRRSAGKLDNAPAALTFI